MQLICEGHPQITGVSHGMRLVLNKPTVLEEPVLQGDSTADAMGCSIYGSVIDDGGTFRMWYQAWPRDWDGSDEVSVASTESDDGVNWRRPSCGLVECSGGKQNNLTDLAVHCPSVFIDPHGGVEKRYRAFGYTSAEKLKGRYDHDIGAVGYYTAYSPDGVKWQFDSAEPTWPHADVITSTWDPYAGRALIALKYNGESAGMFRRRFFTAHWSDGQATEPVSAFIPDEHDDTAARERGFTSADYYGVGLMPTPGPTIGFLWNFRHQRPLGYLESQMKSYGRLGRVDLSIVYQLERGGRWLHLPGRPDWLCAEEAPEWARGALYTASNPLSVGDETWLYFSGTQDRHGWGGVGVTDREWRSSLVGSGGFARIGLAKWRRDRIMGYEASLSEFIDLSAGRTGEGESGGWLALNAATRPGGAIRVALLDGNFEPIAGYGLEECDVLTGDEIEFAVRWRGSPALPAVDADRTLTARVEIDRGTLFAFDFKWGRAAPSSH